MTEMTPGRPAVGLALTLSCPDLGPPATPTVTGIDSNTGVSAGGQLVDVTDTGFTPQATVDFGTTPASSVTYVSSGDLRVVEPPGSGTVDVTVNDQGGTSVANPADEFSYLGVPTVAEVSVGSGVEAGGTPVEVTGSGFTPDATVDFGVQPASYVEFISPTKLMALSPPGTGTADVLRRALLVPLRRPCIAGSDLGRCRAGSAVPWPAVRQQRPPCGVDLQDCPPRLSRYDRVPRSSTPTHRS